VVGYSDKDGVEQSSFGQTGRSALMQEEDDFSKRCGGHERADFLTADPDIVFISVA
jgi:hypothetical protein